MGLPEIFIAFETAAATAITRSARGVLAVVLADETPSAPGQAVYRALSEVPQEQFTAENYRLMQLVFLSAPSKVFVLRKGDDTLAALERIPFNWLAAPGLDGETVVSFIREQRSLGRGVKAVLSDTACDCEGIGNLCAEELVLADGAISARDYTVRIAAALAALPLTRSATYLPLDEVMSCAGYADADAEVDAGKLIIVPGQTGYRLGRAVTSLTTLTPDRGAPFRKIKVVEGIDLIRTDIAGAFESGYIGKVLNDYDNKLLLVTAINTYLKGLEGDVLDKTAENRCFVSLSGQKAYLDISGSDTDSMTDAQILRANTGSEVFLEANLKFCDAMEDLFLRISM